MSHSKTPWTSTTDGEILDADELPIVVIFRYHRHLFCPVTDATYNRAKAKLIVAVSRLSPAVRELLLTNPEAVERSVQAVMSHDPDDVAATMNAFAELSPIIREMMLDNMSEFRRMVDKAYGERLAAEMIASLYEKDSAALKPGRDEG